MNKLLAAFVFSVSSLYAMHENEPAFPAPQITSKWKQCSFREIERQISGPIFNEELYEFYVEEVKRFHHAWASIRTLNAKYPNKIHIALTQEEAIKNPTSFFKFEFGSMNHEHLNELCERNRDVYEELENQSSGELDE